METTKLFKDSTGDTLFVQTGYPDGSVWLTASGTNRSIALRLSPEQVEELRELLKP